MNRSINSANLLRWSKSCCKRYILLHILLPEELNLTSITMRYMVVIQSEYLINFIHNFNWKQQSTSTTIISLGHIISTWAMIITWSFQKLSINVLILLWAHSGQANHWYNIETWQQMEVRHGKWKPTKSYLVHTFSYRTITSIIIEMFIT